MSFQTEGFSAAWCQCGGEKQQQEGGAQGWFGLWRGRWGAGVKMWYNARLFVFSLIFIKLNIKELEGRQFVRVRVFYSSLHRKPGEVAWANMKYTKGYSEKIHPKQLKI